MDRDRNNTKRLAYMKKARDYFDKQIKKEEDKQKRKLTKEERRETRKKNRKMAKMVAILTTSFALGIVGGAEGRHLLDSGHTIEVADKKEHSVTIDDEKVDGITRITNARHTFINGIHVGEDELEIAKNINGALEINTREDVNKLHDKPEEVSTFLKALLAEEYNTLKDGDDYHDKEDITSDNIKEIHRQEAELEKGETRSYSIIEEMNSNRKNLISITMDSKDNQETIVNWEYVKTSGNDYAIAPTFLGDKHGKDAVEYKRVENTLDKLLPVLDKGLDWIDKGARKDQSQAFFESMLEYKKSKMNRIATEHMQMKDGKIYYKEDSKGDDGTFDLTH